MSGRLLSLIILILLVATAVAYAVYDSTALAPTSPVPSTSPVTTSPSATPELTSPSPSTSSVSSPVPSSQTSSLQIISPKQGARVSSPLVVTGQATGNWYFEASFPIELVDSAGKLLAKGVATAQGEWMTTELVPFTATLTFTKPSTSTGTLILKKDNPSGLPENDAEQRIGVSF